MAQPQPITGYFNLSNGSAVRAMPSVGFLALLRQPPDVVHIDTCSSIRGGRLTILTGSDKDIRKFMGRFYTIYEMYIIEYIPADAAIMILKLAIMPK